MSWLGIFKRKPREYWTVPGVTFEDDTPAPGNVAYTAKEVAGAGASADQVQLLVQDITAKAYVASQKGRTGIGYSHDNSNRLKRAGEQLTRMGYSVRFYPGGEGYYGMVLSPLLSINW